MGKKMNLGSWQWPSCANSKTLSFRANDNNIFKTINSVFFDPSDHGVENIETPESWFTNSSESASFSTESDDLLGTGEPLEMIIKGVRSERLFFEPNCTSSILNEEKPSQNQEQALGKVEEEAKEEDEDLPFKESVALAMESEDPYLDFKKSMEEMVETHGIKDSWKSLQELLGWYLKMNGKVNHGFIVGAFVDLLVEFSIVPPTNCTSDSFTTYSSAASSFSSPRTSIGHKEIEDQEKRGSSSSLG
ncbi:transcription repressor OFP13-like [Nicotiana tabacum]|uniref:Transcription repressor n=2 Tax=Nicotiana TaxID=4085 RepID=A0A1S3XFW4_TOBAC|nr:PREDICTED: transcription repressor OFP13-like [Nicotiana sylvestris]XP_016438767.1 PREDICTED: transcription repressor OFP13-like [Nicotiana tabacum]